MISIGRSLDISNALVAAFLQQLLKVVGTSQKWPEFLSLAS